MKIIETKEHEVRMSINFFCNCLLCGGMAFSKIEICDNCKKQLQSKVSAYPNRENLPFKCYSPWGWDQRSFNFCNALAYYLKNKKVINLHYWLAECLLKSVKYTNDPALKIKGLYIIPCPGSQVKKYDHAESLAFAVGKLLGITPSCLLSRSSQQPQKQKSKLQRTSVKFYKKSVVLKNNYRIIFIDDVITSGASARAAWKALGQSASFEVWTLFDRKLDF